MKNFQSTKISTTLIRLLVISGLILGVLSLPSLGFAADTIRVPLDQPTIQAGIDAAQNGDIVLVSPGVYQEELVINKTITLASEFYTTGDSQYINSTVIEGQLNGSGVPITTPIIVELPAGTETKIIGFTIRDGVDGIKVNAKIQILNNIIRGNTDGVDMKNSGGLISHNTFENNLDDGIDSDGATAMTVEYNIIRNNFDDGMEYRVFSHVGSNTSNVIFRNNYVFGNGRDGVQLIDYPAIEYPNVGHVFDFRNNIFSNNGFVGLGIMDNMETLEDYRAGSMLEPVYLFNNTFSGNNYALTGGNNLVALNNLFINSTTLALKNVDANSIVAHNLFWNNTANYTGSNIDLNTTLFTNPHIDINYNLYSSSPAIDAGAAYFEWNSEVVLDLPPGDYSGAAPDLGAYEYGLVIPTPTATPNLSDVIFADGFETGNFSAWSANTPGGGDLSVNSAAAIHGGYGMRALINDTAKIYVTDNLPTAESRYRARFYFDPNSVSIPSGKGFYILYAYDDATPTDEIMGIELLNSGGSYQLRATLADNDFVWKYQKLLPITDAPHMIEVDWQAATPGLNNGSLTLWIDNVHKLNLEDVNNDTFLVGSIRLGVVDSIDAGIAGSIFFDDFESHRQSYIGPVAGYPSTVTPTSTPTYTPTLTLTPTPSSTATYTPSPTKTYTPSPTKTYTPSPTSTYTPSPTKTNTPIGGYMFIPGLRSPRSNLLTIDTTPDFSWNSVTGGQTYDVEFATDTAFTNIVSNETVSSTLLTVTTPFADGKYFWRVRARNSFNQPGLWSSSRSFVIDTTGPSAPVLNTPADGLSIRQPVFRWGSVSTAVSYEFQYDDVNFIDLNAINYRSIRRSTFLRPPAMAPGTYYWRVRAKDALGNWGSWSITRTITITSP